jgi:hypothetical protein
VPAAGAIATTHSMVGILKVEQLGMHETETGCAPGCERGGGEKWRTSIDRGAESARAPTEEVTCWASVRRLTDTVRTRR